MQAGMGNLNPGAHTAKPGFSFQPVHPAVARATFTF